MSSLNYEYMSSTQKVAALLISLGPAVSSEILKNITDDNLLEQITLDIAGLNKVPPEIFNQVVEEFYTFFQASDYISSGGMTYARAVLEKAYGGDGADKILGRLVNLLTTNPFQFFNDADPAQLATSFQSENPQLIALILVYLKPELAAKVLNALSSDMQNQVALKIAEMNMINPEILTDVEKIVENKFSNLVSQDFSKIGGVKSLADILNRSDRSTEQNVLELLENKNPDIAEGVRELMFVFEDIIKLDDRSIQRLLRELDSRDIALALKGVNADLKEKIMSNMSERAQGLLQEDLEYMGPVRAKDVQTMQSKVVSIIRTLENEGEITIVREYQEDELIE